MREKILPRSSVSVADHIAQGGEQVAGSCLLGCFGGSWVEGDSGLWDAGGPAGGGDCWTVRYR